MKNDPVADEIFESEVRRIARFLWPVAEYGGAEMIDGRERDGVFVTEECVHLLEATRSKSKAKAELDINKLTKLAESMRKKQQHKAVQCWFITESEPTADQRSVRIKGKEKVNILSFRQFENHLIDASSYLSLRIQGRFGSVQDPASGEITPKTEYVPLNIVENRSGEIWNITQLVSHLLSGGKTVFLGNYGAGKSMTMRELFLELRRKYLKGTIRNFPIYINMRDHFGQKDPTEILERHARQVGFSYPSHLVRAWRAGYAILFIDGFDEVTTLGFQGAWKKLRDTRYQSMEAIRRFVRDTPQDVGLALAGRPQFFDNDSERETALGLGGKFKCLTLDEFDEVQLKEYLRKAGAEGTIPVWMPARPLLVAYLVAKELIAGNADIVDANREEGWDHLLDGIANREAQIEAGIDGATVRRIFERLATKARASTDGLGPITEDQVVEAYKEVCGGSPDAEGMVLLQRLPGLGVSQDKVGTRSFVDIDFADACRAGDVVRFIEDPYNTDSHIFDGNECCIGELGVLLSVVKLPISTFPRGKMDATVQYIRTNEIDRTIKTDVVRIAAAREDDVKQAVYIKDVIVPSWDLEFVRGNISKVTFQESYFESIEIEKGITSNKLPRFSSCFVGRIEGRINVTDLPKDVFGDDCIFDSFSDLIGTTSGILQLSLPLGTKVLLTILRKLYIQKGRGRRESALLRGLDQRGQRLVPSVLELLEREKLAVPGKIDGRKMWFPDRSHMSRVGKILATPHESRDSVCVSAAKLA